MDVFSDIIVGAFIGFIIGYVIGFCANYFDEMRLEKKAIGNNKNRRRMERFDCYMKYGNKDETCYGIYGGDIGTDYLSYSCIGCPYNVYTGKKDINE